MDQILPLLLMIAVLYFLIIAPSIKKQKKEKNFMASVKKGDRIITKSGIHGKIVELNDKDNTCVIETGAGKIKFERAALSVEATERLNKSNSQTK
ncbi:protein translocase subunit yajC [Kordia periserrulae]|uniref:Sec translocon accessory complex subunit YajC n=1 Tax=Kordia periserrulae TaxID=701523 RepID=A0A2T6C3W6_9FLAO|nr:preprotein translocase subunit YajC [Kordia periserrulae]PTX62998.1 protein translocase subunit yajC [Kordia periserrulae]